ncbi:hypothetical protein AB0Y38_02810 [Lysinibacillus capsici]|uniref:Uncharacterized protein n=1 Tax=Lysinibacillus capsici TaxID=2115968 RepID=A0A2X1A593_9BACI|nr:MULTISPECIES: hypothetical protein [Lysinibacillus]AUS87131.1 hypothetical protein LBYS11_12680 [Lysinibacillus sp. YS11]KMN40263.1 hypothetical protein VK91_10850 [Lysinibacillus sp. LK3]MED4551327.1 hypothetical protein [Lysinibacillus capsici]WPK03583.1 hypothetical protein R6U76_12915 [Lysinibacillus capsici]SPU38620.1 Uncharacterised protein [Lysinibacillus capsici]
MNNCPNCLASNPFKKVYRDGLVFVKCEYCNTIFEDTLTRKKREVSERVRKEVQNKVTNEENIRAAEKFVWGIVVLLIIAVIIDAMLLSN